MELLFFLHLIPQHHELNLPNYLMVEEKTGFEVFRMKPEGKMPLSLSSEWILGSFLEITRLDEEEDLVETAFR
jgi:hypothetical protein